MSHFTLLVTKTNEKDLDEQLAPFDHELELPLHIIKSKQQFIEDGRQDVANAKEKIAQYDSDPVAYEANYPNQSHIEWVKGKAREIAKVTDEEELFKIGAKHYLLADEDEVVDKNGNLWGTSNDKAKWDWYSVGGRWAGYFIPKQGASGVKGTISLLCSDKHRIDFATSNSVDVIRVSDIDWPAMDAREKQRRSEYYDKEMSAQNEDQRFMFNSNRSEIMKMTRDEYTNLPISHATFAVLHDGAWYEKGEMGYWGLVSDEKEGADWDIEWQKLVDSLPPDTEVTLVDCHI